MKTMSDCEFLSSFLTRTLTLTIFLIAFLVTGSAATYGAITASDAEAAGSAAGLEGAYLDFIGQGDTIFSTRAGFESYNLTSSASDWGFPDGSDGEYHVNGDSYDSKGAVASNFSVTNKGLDVTRYYELWVKSKYNGSGFGHRWGFNSSANNQTINPTSQPPGSNIIFVAEDPTAETDSSHFYQLRGTGTPNDRFTPNGFGEIVIWFGQAGSRTQLDGLFMIPTDINNTDDDNDGL